MTLGAFTDALREETRSPKDHPETLARIVWSLAPQRKRSRLRLGLIVPIAAAFVALGAFAAARSGIVTVSVPSKSPDGVVRDKGQRIRESEQRTVAKVAPTLEPTIEPQPLPVVVPLPVAPSATASVTVDEDALYRDARDAHFVRKDPAAAVVAWDRYLAGAGPTGRFALEAKYNRAISLVRVGRAQEAITALRPFADGEYGGYRREEATRVLSTLEPSQ